VPAPDPTGLVRQLPRAAVALTLFAALMCTSLATGGYTFGGQRLLLALTALLVLELICFAPAAVSSAMAVPLAAILGLLAAWTAASAIWTVGAPADAIRWAGVTLDLAVLVPAAAVLARWQGPRTIAAAITGVAVVQGVIGTWALALRHIPEAVLLSDSWRPAGNFEYAPALTLLEVCALPFSLMLAASPSRWRAGAGAFALAIFGLNFGTEDSRLPLALAVATVIVLAVKADRLTLAPRDLCAAAALLAVAAVAGDLTLGRQDLGDHPGTTLEVIATFAACVAGAVAWPWLRRAVAHLPAGRLWLGAAVLAGLAVGAWVLAGYTSTLTGSGGGLDHARFSYWSSAFNVWREHPVLGSGAETFFASASHFQLSDDLTLFAHDLPLELAAELGIPGFLLAVGLYLAAGRDIGHWLTHRAGELPDAWLLAPASGAFLIQNLFDWPWHFAALGAVWAVAAGGVSGMRGVERAGQAGQAGRAGRAGRAGSGDQFRRAGPG
jgi:hypothetical protein